jgi:hypothetical protein
MSNKLGAIMMAASFCLLGACNPLAGLGQRPDAGPKASPAGPQKLLLKGMVAEGADLSSFITGCAGNAGLQLDELVPGPAGKEANRRTVQVTVSGGFQGIADFVACFGQGEAVWEFGRLQVWRGPPKFFEYRLELQVSVIQGLTVPGPEFKDQAEAAKWLQALPARVNRATALLSGVYLATEPALELREISLSADSGTVKGRAMNYPEISGLMAELQAKGLVRNARVETIQRVLSKSVEKDQEFELAFDW